MQKCVFTGQDSFHRVKQLQELCKDYECDAILLVGGADGLYSQGSQAALKYLFLGKSGQELLGEQVIPQQFENLEDIVIVLTSRAISIFYILDSDSATFLLPLICSWRNVIEYVATDDMPQDVRELKKIQAFRDMTEPHATIGIPLDTKSDPKMTAEKWPLVQAYGLDEISGRGFFTMHHNVLSCTGSLANRMKILDAYCARRLVNDAAPTLLHHFGGFLDKLENSTPADRAALSEVDAGDDLTSFYEFGTIRDEARGLVKPNHRGARLLFGTRTATPTAAASKAITPAHAGVRGFAASHFTIVAEDPLTGLRAARTYFLGTGKCGVRIVDTEALVHTSLEKLDRYDSIPNNALDTRHLIDLYLAVLEVHTDVLSEFVSMTKTNEPLKKCVENLQALASQLYAKRLDPGLRALATQLTVNAEYIDACGESTALSSAKWAQAYITVTLNSIPSIVVPGEILGSIIVGDTVLFDPNEEKNEALILTADFARVKAWIQAGQEADFASHVDDVLQSEYMLENVLRVGREIGDSILHASILIHSDQMPSGFVLHSPSCQPLIVSFPTDAKTIRILLTPHEELLLIVIEFRDEPKNSVHKCLPCQVNSTSIALPLLAGSRMQEALLGVLEKWKHSAAAMDIPLIKPSDVNDQETKIPVGFQRGCDKLLGHDDQSQVKNRFFPPWFIAKSGLNPVSTWIKPKSHADPINVPVTVFVGVPGSDVQSIACSLIEVSSSTNEWHHVIVEIPHETDSTQLFPCRLASALDGIDTHSSWERRPRILLTVVGYVDTITICAAIKSSPQGRRLKLSAVTAVVSGVALHQPKSFNPVPKLWDQLVAGFVTTIVLTCIQELSKTQLHRLRMRVDAVNPFADVLCLRSASFSDCGDLSPLLALDGFETTDRVNYRDAHFPQWQTSPSTYVVPTTDVSAVRFEMQLSVDRYRFLACIQKGLFSHTNLKTTTPVYPLQLPVVELKGLRLAQALAMEKVQQSAVYSTEKEVDLPDNISALASESGCVWTLEASLSFSNDNQHSYAYLNTGSKAFLRPLPPMSAPVCSFVFTGTNLQADKLRQLLLLCCPARYSVVAAVRGPGQITPEEKREIQARHVTDPLPDGYMFDGTSYYDYFGGQYEFHPNIQEFINAYLSKKNDAARLHNIELEQDLLRCEERTKQCV
ncbi:hypothetical protein AeNC1_005372 [Aphanomyces euteiches]|nr:hypothetical protein AeNC1_005372 [Aphanomyces euteiches]